MDGLSNSLLSGSCQTSFIRKFKASGISTSEVFVNSLKYSVPYRLMIPLVGLGLFNFLEMDINEQILYVIGYVLLLRIVVIFRVRYDLKGLVFQKGVHVNASAYARALLISIVSIKKTVILAAYYSMISSLAAAYFLPSLQHFLRSHSLKENLIHGSIISLIFYFKVVILSWAVVKIPRLSSLFSNHLVILAFILVSSLCIILSETFVQDTGNKLALQYTAVFSLFFHTFYGLRKVQDDIANGVINQTEAGVISTSETIAMSMFCVLGIIGFIVTKIHFYIFLNCTFLLIGVLITIWQFKKNPS